jgi:putative ABC transport system substrate-binding protein
VRRRDFIQQGLGAVCYVALRLPHANAQQAPKKPRIAYLTSGAGTETSSYDNAFLEGLQALGYVPGETLDYRRVGGAPGTVPRAAAELVASRVDVIVAAGNPAISAAQRATTEIPIVIISSDPIAAKHVSSLARPGGNMTGRSLLASELGTKRLELLKEAAPGLFRVAVMFSADNPSGRRNLTQAQEVAPALGLEILPVAVGREQGFEKALAMAAEKRAGAALLLSQGQTVNPDADFNAAILKHRLPTMFTSKSFVAGGGLMSYGPDVAAVYRDAALHVDRILKGAKPGDLPVEAPTKFELAINLKTAAALGLTIPPTLLARADEVIE